MTKQSVYERVTADIVKRIEQGPSRPVEAWHKVIAAFATPDNNAVTGNAYSGINTLILAVSRADNAYKSNVWATFKQWKNMGCKIVEGSKSTPIVFYGSHTKEDENGDDQTYRFAKSYNVFNSEQVIGHDVPMAVVPAHSALSENERIARCDAFFKAIPAKVVHLGNRACYQPSTDSIILPEWSQFKSAAMYYATYAHELSHWSGHRTRLDRDLAGKFGSVSYAKEELIAELSSAYIAARLGFDNDALQSNAAGYLKGWLSAAKKDPKFLFQSASAAQTATNYLYEQGRHGLKAIKQPAQADLFGAA